MSAKVGQPFNVVVKFASTMPIHLTSCKWMVDGPGLLRMSEKSHRYVHQIAICGGGVNQIAICGGGVNQIAICGGGVNQIAICGGGVNQIAICGGGVNQIAICGGGVNQIAICGGGKETLYICTPFISLIGNFAPLIFANLSQKYLLHICRMQKYSHTRKVLQYIKEFVSFRIMFTD